MVSLESGVDEAVLAEMLQRLLTLVPGNEFLSRRGKEGWLVRRGPLRWALGDVSRLHESLLICFSATANACRFSLDVERVAELALAIKAALPHASVPDMLQARPEILDMSAAEFQAALESCRSNLGAQTVADVGSLVSELPDLVSSPRASRQVKCTSREETRGYPRDSHPPRAVRPPSVRRVCSCSREAHAGNRPRRIPVVEVRPDTPSGSQHYPTISGHLTGCPSPPSQNAICCPRAVRACSTL